MIDVLRGGIVKDEYGRVDNKAQAIRSLDELRLSYLLNDIKSNPDKYKCPDDPEGWLEWLNKEIGEDALHL